eukprot:gnl/MRDRNA2_/MRDRNA2_86430_c0_seq7.p1 gnl/MRDRNA2_/MRDRNA2_86430_c0~~gnl/MRDRNA2_/MRDRNA2_86430_c0_seq7.p1  ORF type:complete len:540 (+),score=130.54 gnl/MRDRNA2_/MRDRNA2_86430_c0_seq7:155-1621(+)
MSSNMLMDSMLEQSKDQAVAVIRGGLIENNLPAALDEFFAQSRNIVGISMNSSGDGAAPGCPEDFLEKMIASQSPSTLSGGSECVVTFLENPLTFKHYQGCLQNVTQVKMKAKQKYIEQGMKAVQLHAQDLIANSFEADTTSEELKLRRLKEVATNLYNDDDAVKSFAAGTVKKLKLKRLTQAAVNTGLNHAKSVMSMRSVAMKIKEKHGNKLKNPSHWDAPDDQKAQHFATEFQALNEKIGKEEKNGLTLQQRADEAKKKVEECLSDKRQQLAEKQAQGKKESKMIQKMMKEEDKCAAKPVEAKKVDVDGEKKYVFTQDVETEIEKLAEITVAILGLLNLSKEYEEQMIKIYMDILQWLQTDVTLQVTTLQPAVSPAESVLEANSFVTSDPVSIRDIQISSAFEELESSLEVENTHKEALEKMSLEEIRSELNKSWKQRMRWCWKRGHTGGCVDCLMKCVHNFFTFIYCGIICCGDCCNCCGDYRMK